MLLLAMPDARAGSYTVTYSGGQSVSVGVNVPGGTLTTPYSGTYGGAASTSWAVAGNSATCSGPIKATATWQSNGPGDNPPATAVVVETGTATWSGTGVLVPTGHCKDGLSDPEIDTTTPPAQPGAPTKVSGISQGVHYSVKSNPGLSFPLTPSPLATVSCGVTQGGGSASVSYTAAVYPVYVTPGGAIQDSTGAYNILVGQGCTASLSTLPGTVSNWHWSVSGTTFQDWEPTTPAFPKASPPTLANPQASYFSGGSGPLTNAMAHWYWNDPNQATETISCTATVTPPAGQGSPFSVTATKTVIVQLPTWKATGIGGYMQVNTTAPNDDGQISLHAGPVAGQLGGMNWVANSSTPTLFGNGTLELVQLVTPNMSYDTYTNPEVYHPDPENGQVGLDTKYPYSWATVANGANPYAK